MTVSSRIIDGLKTNTLYSFQVKAKNSMGVWSDLPTAVTHTTLKDTTAPAVLSSITLLMLAGVFQLKWAKPATLDLRGGGYKVYVYTANTPASAVLIREVGYTADSTEIFIGETSQDVSITITAGTTYYFWVATLDDSGNESAKVATTPTSGSVAASGGGGGGTTWNEVVGTSQAMIINNGYIANNAALVTLTLPATAILGSLFEICGKEAGGWKIAQNAGQTIHFGNLNTTTGAGGYLASTLTYDAVRLLVITADTDLIVLESIGNITVV